MIGNVTEIPANSCRCFIGLLWFPVQKKGETFGYSYFKDYPVFNDS